MVDTEPKAVAQQPILQSRFFKEPVRTSKGVADVIKEVEVSRPAYRPKEVTPMHLVVVINSGLVIFY